jgi:sulfoacetaldehyde acetyltransferase
MSAAQLSPHGRHWRTKVTPSRRYVETLVAQGVGDVRHQRHSFMDHDGHLRPPESGWSVVHEQGGGHMADGYARASGRHGASSARTGPASATP